MDKEKIKEKELLSDQTGSATETESDEFNDNISILSDSLSVSSNKIVKKNEIKKIIASLQKLKQENFALRETLEQTKASDIALLKTKLRGANADLMRLKQTNGEYKERIQSLEEKLVAVLSIQTDSSADIYTKDNSNFLKEKLKQKNIEKSILESKVEVLSQHNNPIPTKDNNQTYDHKIPLFNGDYFTLQNRCRHFERLSKSYEKTVELLQAELHEIKSKDSLSGNNLLPLSSASDPSHKTKSVEFTQPPQPLSSNTNVKEMLNHPFVQQILEELRNEDQKTIKELAQEVKRLTTLLPRKLINEQDAFNSSIDNISPNKSSIDEPIEPISQTTTTPISTSTIDSKPLNQTNSFDFIHMLFAFLIGAFLMLFSVLSVQSST